MQIPISSYLIHFLNESDVQDRLGVGSGARAFSNLSHDVAELLMGIYCM